MFLVNAVLALAVELGALAAVGRYGWHVGGAFWAKALLAAGFACLFIALWARFAAPRAKSRLRGTRLVGFKAAVFVAGAASLWATGAPGWAAALAALAALQLALAAGFDLL